ncbi:chorismate synthase [Candidatus Bathyarchaeota archaeon]|nr:chorismate synthase [Candidatus Bathyarchaeota archaeon]
MSSNSFGKLFVITSFGESHGKCVGVVVDGCPAGLRLTEADIQAELDKRRPGIGDVTTGRIEEDRVEILSGVFNEHTSGAPICMLIWNRNLDSSFYEQIRYKPRPGHADYPAYIKYGGFNDYRGGGRFSGRITASLVMAGAIAKKLLKQFDVEVVAHAIEIGEVKLNRKVTITEIRKNVYRNNVRCADLKLAPLMEEQILKAKEAKDSVGGIVECLALNLPVGLGEPFFDSLDADIAKILFDIPAVKGVEFGIGFQAAHLKGSENNDQYIISKGKISLKTNNSGGILGGLSTGMPLIVKAAFKPTPSIGKPQKTVNLQTMKESTLEIEGRYDPCIVPRAVPVVESATAIVLVDHMLRSRLIPPVLKKSR